MTACASAAAPPPAMETADDSASKAPSQLDQRGIRAGGRGVGGGGRKLQRGYKRAGAAVREQRVEGGCALSLHRILPHVRHLGCVERGPKCCQHRGVPPPHAHGPAERQRLAGQQFDHSAALDCGGGGG
eukprot:CAMPEP_0180115118 /NCGR_PEP_ID=MMETSP0985-20121206/37682_1 /TAXON_ID=483367 /ORGANISM="non described non described, Strain CCMP 2436" /LENGTH=128 /DNA_ID=CAMNT_0022053741 /DNA_START=56 /DNA_END=440 /DNA_ORIENTATION=+